MRKLTLTVQDFGETWISGQITQDDTSIDASGSFTISGVHVHQLGLEPGQPMELEIPSIKTEDTKTEDKPSKKK